MTAHTSSLPARKGSSSVTRTQCLKLTAFSWRAMGQNSVHSLLINTHCQAHVSHHFARFLLGFNLSLYLTAESEACASAKEGALFPIKAYSSREIPSGRLTLDCGLRAVIVDGPGTP